MDELKELEKSLEEEIRQHNLMFERVCDCEAMFSFGHEMDADEASYYRNILSEMPSKEAIQDNISICYSKLNQLRNKGGQ